MVTLFDPPYAPLAPRDKLIALVVFALALLWLVLFAGGQPGYTPDGATNLHMAQNLAAGEGLVTKTIESGKTPHPQPTVGKPPLYASSAASLIVLGIPPLYAAWVVSAGAYAAAVALLFILARQALPLWPALLVPVLFAAQVTSTRWGISIHEQSLFVALTFATLWRLTVLGGGPASSAHWGQYALVGTLAALAMITSYQGLPLLLVATVCVLVMAGRGQRFTALLAYAGGLILVAAWPFVRFVLLWTQGIRHPGFNEVGDSYYRMLAGIVSAFQNDVFGRQLVWLYDGLPSDLLIVVGFFSLLLALLVYTAWRWAPWRPLAAFTVLYLVMLVAHLGQGKAIYEPRYSMPVNGLILLFVIYAFHELICRWKELRIPVAGFGVLALAVFAYAQISRYPDLLKGHGAMCPAPQTLAWIKSHIPSGAVIASTQCGYRIKAESIDYYWLPIPPARDFTVPRRWNEDDFLKMCSQTPSPWIVLFNNANGKPLDPFREKPGYGPYVETLFAGHSTTHAELVARTADGLVYQLNCGPK